MDSIRDMNNIYMRKKPKKDDDKKDKVNKRMEVIKNRPGSEQEKNKPIRSKEEIQSIVNRLYYSRLNNRSKIISETLRPQQEVTDKQFATIFTPIVDLNNNFNFPNSL